MTYAFSLCENEFKYMHTLIRMTLKVTASKFYLQGIKACNGICKASGTPTDVFLASGGDKFIILTVPQRIRCKICVFFEKIASTNCAVWLAFFQQHAVRLYFFNRRLHYCLKFYVSKYQALFEQYNVFTTPSAIEEAAPKLHWAKRRLQKCNTSRWYACTCLNLEI